MAKVRKNIYFTQQQAERLAHKSKQEHLPEAEIVRRALDAYLAWDDPTYAPHPNPRSKKTRLSGPFAVIGDDQNQTGTCHSDLS